MLSNREIENLKLVALGYSAKEAAELLFISEETVIFHRKQAKLKLSAKNLAHAVYIAINAGLL